MYKRKLLYLTAPVLIVLLLGPRPPKLLPKPLHFTLPDYLDGYLEKEESQIVGIRSGLQKKILWVHGKKKSARALVYIHGFSASRMEISPVVETLSQKIKANTYFTRLSGHGIDGMALGKATAQDWWRDTLEAYEVGNKIGDNVILIGTSTGAALSILLATEAKVAALILISPNFQLKDYKSNIFFLPWGAKFAEILLGNEIIREPHNDAQSRYWTTRYPTSSLTQMLAVTSAVNRIDFSLIRTPVLMIYTPYDDVIDTGFAIQKFNEFSSPNKKLVQLSETRNHVLAGDAVSPEMSTPVINTIYEFLTE